MQTNPVYQARHAARSLTFDFDDANLQNDNIAGRFASDSVIVNPNNPNEGQFKVIEEDMDEDQQQQVLEETEAELAGVVDPTVQPDSETGEVTIVNAEEPTEIPVELQQN